MKEECIICKAPIIYLEKDEMMECVLCHSYIAIISAIDYVAENFNIQMEKPVIKCIHSDKNNQCIKERCPFHE